MQNPEFKYYQKSLTKFPSSSSIHLIDYFLIIGYEDIYIQEKIIKEIQTKEISSSNTKTNILKIKDYPSVLSSIGSDYEGHLLDDEDIIKSIFPSETVDIYYNKGDNTDLDLKTKGIIIFKKDENIINNGLAYFFYEGITLPNMFKIYLPKIFVIISQYQFYSTYYQICKEIHNLFYSNNNQIPIELQLYNIINFIPVPIGKRLDLTLFPFYELSNINKCQCNEEFISLDEQKIYSLERIKGYIEPEINIGEIFEVINIELIVEIYLKILEGHNVSIIYYDFEILSIIIFLFNQFLFPLNISENNFIKKNSSSDDYEYFYEFNPDNKNSKIILDLNKKSSNLKIEGDEKNKKMEDFINSNSEFGEKIKQLINNLKEIKDKTVRFKDKNKKYNFFEKFNEKETEENDYAILNSFYKFNLYISEHYCHYYINPKDDNNDNEEEKIFYNNYSKSIYSNIINKNEEKLVIQKIILEQILNYKKHFGSVDLFDNLDIFDLIYKPKESDKFEPLTFLKFYKYYSTNFQNYFDDIISNNYVDCKKDKSEKQNCLYKYKKVNLDKNILLKYNYLLEQMPLEDKNKCFPYIDKNSISTLQSEIKIKDISNIFDLMLINNKVLSNIDIISSAILNIVAISTSGHKLIYFTECIYDLIKNINISLNKYIEIFLSIAYRVFSNEKNQNLSICEKYFNIYNLVVDNNLININNNINIIQEKIGTFVESIKEKSKEIQESNDYKSLKDSDNKKLYSLDPKLKDKEVLNVIANIGYNGNIKNNKITFKAKILKDKPININDVFSPLKVLNNSNKMLDEYYLNLDFGKINKDEYRKMIVHLIYYCNLFPNDFNKEIIKFLLYCLKNEKN